MKLPATRRRDPQRRPAERPAGHRAPPHGHLPGNIPGDPRSGFRSQVPPVLDVPAVLWSALWPARRRSDPRRFVTSGDHSPRLGVFGGAGSRRLGGYWGGTGILDPDRVVRQPQYSLYPGSNLLPLPERVLSESPYVLRPLCVSLRRTWFH